MMIDRRLPLILNAGVVALLVACGDDTDALRERGESSPQAEVGNLPEALQCTVKPTGRSYKLFDGSKLEDTRLNENSLANRSRVKPYAVMANEYERVLGVIPKGLDGAGASFDAPPERWYAEPAHNGVSLNASFSISFEACTAALASSPEHAQVPTDESAGRYCTTFMRKAWSQSPSPEEISGCVELATKKLGDEPDARRRWSYVCASILSSSHFLTF